MINKFDPLKGKLWRNKQTKKNDKPVKFGDREVGFLRISCQSSENSEIRPTSCNSRITSIKIEARSNCENQKRHEHLNKSRILQDKKLNSMVSCSR